MTNKAVKFGIVGIAVVLLFVVAFVGIVSADYVTINSAAEWNAFAAGSDNYSKDIVLGKDLNFTGVTIQPLNKISFSGTINGSYHTISNFSISGSSYLGLIGSYTGSKISNLTISNFSVSGSHDVGGLVGAVSYASTFENVIIMNGVVTGDGYDVGGLVGYTGSSIKEFVNCTVKNCRVSSGFRVGGMIGCSNSVRVSVNASWVNGCDLRAASDSVGGLVGYAYAGDVYVNVSWVNGCDMSAGSNGVGGLVGYARSASTKIDLKNSEVVNCVVKSGTGYSGGCLGYNDFTASNNRTIDNCTVRNCAIYATSGSDPCGGVIGGSVQSSNPTVYPFVSNCTVEFCTIAGNGNGAVGGIAGTFPSVGIMERNKVIGTTIVSKSGFAAGICPVAS